MLYNKAVHWLTIKEIPYFILVIPILDFVSFLLLYFIISSFYSVATSASKDIGYFLMVMMNVTFFYCQVIISEWFFVPSAHGCGPIPDNVRAWDPMVEEIKREHPILSVIYTLFTFFPLLWTILANIVLLGLFAGNKAEILEQYANDKKLDY
jgi:hypothetical protein